MAAESVRAEPSLRVRALTRIELRYVRDAAPPRIEGTLRDDLDAAVAEQELQLRIDACAEGIAPEMVRVRSDRHGRFRVALAQDATACAARASFDGGDYYERSSATIEIDPALADVALEIAIAGGVTQRLGRGEVDVTVRATSSAGAAGLRTTLVDELGRELAAGATNEDGVFRASLPREALGVPGLGKLTATTARDPTRADARTEISVVRLLPTELQLTATLATTESPTLGVSGALRGEIGPPDWLASKTVAVLVDDAHLATVLTDARGAFQQRIALPAGTADGTQRLAISARFEPDAPWFGASRAKAVAVELAPRKTHDPSWLAVPVALSIALATWLSMRARPPVPAAARGRITAPGVRPSIVRRRGTSATLHHVDGCVRDATTGEPLTAATVVVRSRSASDAQAITLPIARDGSFGPADLAPGEYLLRARADGYAAAEAVLTIPHAGEASGLTVNLASLRVLALEAHKPIAERVFDKSSRAETATPRDTLRWAARSEAAERELLPLLEPLTQHVEHVGYAAATPTPSDLEQVLRGTQQVLDATDPPDGSSRFGRARFPHHR